MTPAALFRRLVGLCWDLGGIAISDLDPADIDPLMTLQESGKVILTNDPPMVWINPAAIRGRRGRSGEKATMVESDLPPDVEYLKHTPDRDSQPVRGLRLNGEPVYRPHEPSELVAMGDLPWPLEGTEIRSRWYRPARAKWTTFEVRDLVVTAERCPVCGSDGKRNNPNCTVCDCWPHNYPKTVRTLEAEPEPEKIKKPRKKAKVAS